MPTFVSQLQGRALAFGAVTFAALHLTLSVALAPALVDWSPAAGYPVALALQIAVIFGTGFLVGYLARRAPFLHGAAIAAAMALVAALHADGQGFSGAFSAPVYFLWFWLYAAVLGSLGALAGTQVVARNAP